MTTILANATLVLPDRVMTGALVMDQGRIARIDAGADVPAGAEDCGGDLVMPGLIELHTDNLERHIQPRPGVDWPHAAAIIAHDAELAGVGITTVFDALRVGSLISRSQGAREYARGMADEILAARDRGEDVAPFIVESARPLAELERSGLVGVAIRWALPEAPDPSIARSVARVVAAHPGPAPLYIDWSDGNGTRVRFRSRRLRVEPRDETLRDLRVLFGGEAVSYVRSE